MAFYVKICYNMCMLNIKKELKMKTYLKLTNLRNSFVGSEAVKLNYYSTNLGSELDTHFTIVEDTAGCDIGVFNNEELNIVENVTVTFAGIYGTAVDRRLHTTEIEAVICSEGIVWVDAEIYEEGLI